MAIIRKPETLSRAFNQILFRTTEPTLQIQLQYPNDSTKVVTLTGVQRDGTLTTDVSGIVKYLFKDMRISLNTTQSAGWLFVDYNLKVNYRVNGELFSALNAVTQPGRIGAIPAVQTMRVAKNNVYTVPKYAGYPVGICLAHNPNYDADAGVVVVSGIFTDSITGRPIPNAIIRFTSPDGTTTYGAAFTDANGAYTFNWEISPTAYPSNLRYEFTAPNYVTNIATLSIPAYDEAIENGIDISGEIVYYGSIIHISGTVTATGETINSGDIVVVDANDETHRLITIPIVNGAYAYDWPVTQAEYDSYTAGLVIKAEVDGYYADDVTVSQPYADAVANGITVDFTLTQVSVTANPTSLLFDEAGSTQDITVTTVPANMPVTGITTSHSWIMVVQDGNVLHVSAATTTQDRSGNIYITANGQTIQILVNQVHTSGYIVVNPTEKAIQYNDTTPFTIEVNSSSAWTLTGLPAWLTADVTSGTTGTTTVTLTPTQNGTSDSRLATFTFTNENSDVTTSTIVQGTIGKLLIAGRIVDYASSLPLSNVAIQLSADATGNIATIYTNAQGVYTYDWSVSESIYNQNSTLTALASLVGYNDNSGTWTLQPYSTISTIPAIIDILLSETGVEIVMVNGSSSSQLNDNGYGGSYAIDITSNASWQVSYYYGSSWTVVPPPYISGLPNSGSGNQNLIMNIASNTAALRNISIRFTTPIGEFAQVNVTQQSIVVAMNINLNINLVARGGVLPDEGEGIMNVYNEQINAGSYIGDAFVPESGLPGQPPNYNAKVMFPNMTMTNWNKRGIFTFELISPGGYGVGQFTVSADWGTVVSAQSTTAEGYYVGTVYID